MWFTGNDTQVRVKLDNPLNVVDKKALSGRFRAGDVKWNPEIRTVKKVVLLPNMPPLYFLNNVKNPN